MKDLQGSLSNRYIYNPKGLPCYRGSLQSGTRGRWNQCGGWQVLGYLEGRAGRPSWVQGDGHSETWQKSQHLKGRPAGTTAHRTERACASCKPKVRHVRRCVDTFPGQYCNGGAWNASGDSGAEDIYYGTGMHQQGMPCEVRR
jgi:hypothetical protein